MPYRYRDDVAIADVAFEASGKTMEKMLEAAALATTNTMVKDLRSVKKKEERVFEVEAKTHDELLHGFLQELVFFKDADLLLFSEYSLKLEKGRKGYVLKAACTGEQLDMKKHELLADVKAVSWHMLRVWQDRKTGEWRCFVILDV